MTQALKDPVIIVLSDAHLGASKSQSFLLYEFLLKINNKQYDKDVKALIILGDFFDVCMDNCEDIQREFSYLLNEISKLLTQIPVVFSLGNHEIKVTGNNETKFQKRKSEFIDEFQDPPFNGKTIGQYINIRRSRTVRDNLEIVIYNSLKSFDKNHKPIETFLIDNPIDNGKKFSCLLTHGHQLESTLTLWFVGGLVWGRLIKKRDRIYKKFMDFLWNSLISGEVSISNLNKRDIKYLIKKENLSKRKAIKYRRNLKHIREWELRKIEKRNEKYLKKAKKLLRKKDRDDKLTHFVFGHSHTTMTEKELKIKKRIKKTFGFYNPGSWQKIERPTYLEIGLDSLNITDRSLEITPDLKSLRDFNEYQNSSFRKLRRKLIEASPDRKRSFLLYSEEEMIVEAFDLGIINEGQRAMLEKIINLREIYYSNPKTRSDINSFMTDEFDDQFQI